LDNVVPRPKRAPAIGRVAVAVGAWENAAMPPSLAGEPWPDLPYAAWRDTCATLHLWTQIVGKVRLAQTPWLNHSWHVTLYVTPRGLGTGPIPHGADSFQINFDFIDHDLVIAASDGGRARLPLKAQPVADFYAELMRQLDAMGLAVRINEMPNEIAEPIRFSADRVHRSYQPDYAFRFGVALRSVDQVLKLFRTSFLGKASPVHFFWGSFDLAVTRFSGRRAPLHPGGIPHLPDVVTREAYSHEVSSAGFWPGGNGVDYPAFYSYCYPTPAAFRGEPVRPVAASFHEGLGEFILPYDAVRNSAAPEETLLAFLQSTYEAAANSGRWDRAALECDSGKLCVPRRL
jgi:hypothetical protein